MNIFTSHSRKDSKVSDQLNINQLSTSIKELQTISRALRTMEKKWEKSDPTAYQRWLGAFVDFYEEEQEGDLVKNITRICKRWNGGHTEQKDLCDTAPHIYDDGELCLTVAGSYQLDTSIGEINKDIIVQELVKVSNQLVLIDSDTIDTKNFSRIINEHLTTYRETRDDLYLINAAQAYFALREKSKKKKRVKVNDLAILKRRSSSGITRDLRQSFRRIVRFLFKNMEADEDSNVLFADRINQSLLTTSKLQNEYKKTYREIRMAY